jgi:hypothetical protein
MNENVYEKCEYQISICTILKHPEMIVLRGGYHRYIFSILYAGNKTRLAALHSFCLQPLIKKTDIVVKFKRAGSDFH